jgi:hypothetical protein
LLRCIMWVIGAKRRIDGNAAIRSQADQSGHSLPQRARLRKRNGRARIRTAPSVSNIFVVNKRLHCLRPHVGQKRNPEKPLNPLPRWALTSVYRVIERDYSVADVAHVIKRRHVQAG